VLEKIIGKKSKVNLLRFFMNNDNQGYCLDEIAKSTGLSCGTIYPSLTELLETRIILQRKVGRSILYTVNKNHILFHKIKELIDFEKKSLQIVAREFASSISKRNIKAIVLFGSVARGEFTEKSDIDVLIVYKNKNVKKEVEYLIDKLLDTYDVHIIPIFLTEKDIQDRIKIFDNFIINFINEGQLLYGDAIWLKKQKKPKVGHS
jgi:predicted nucleotidyltransferase